LVQDASPSYALLRHGVSPGDPHLIAPALPEHQLIPPYRPDRALPAAAAADLRHYQHQQEEAIGQLKAELRGLGDQLGLLRQSASSWQQVTAAVTGVDSRCAANTSQLAALGAGVAEVRAAQGRLREASSAHHQEVQGCLAALGGRLDSLAQAAPKSDAAELQPLDSRLERAEQALAGLQARLDQQAAVPASGIDLAVTAAAAAAVAGVQAELGAVQGAQRGTAQRHEAQQAQLGGIQSDLQALQGTHGRVEGQLAAQQAWLSAQLAELRAAQGSAAQQQGGQMERLAAQLAEVAAQMEQHAQQLQQQLPAPGSLQAEQLQQLVAVQAAVDDINQRLFELRVEVQNATEDTASDAAANKRQVSKGTLASCRGLAAAQLQTLWCRERNPGLPVSTLHNQPLFAPVQSP
jgi:chromosome segregation ATPase